jgi:hypothetical protein
MSPHSLKYPRAVAAEALCRAALKQGYLIKFGRRLFHSITVNALIDTGEAVRVGDCVVAWSPQS